MNMQTLERLPILTAVVLVVLVVAACAIRLRDDEAQTNAAASDVASDPSAAKLTECRSVTYEQKDALSECRKAWAEKRRQFLGQKTPPLPDSGPHQAGSSLFVAPKDETRLPSGYPSIQQTGKE